MRIRSPRWRGAAAARAGSWWAEPAAREEGGKGAEEGEEERPQQPARSPRGDRATRLAHHQPAPLRPERTLRARAVECTRGPSLPQGHAEQISKKERERDRRRALHTWALSPSLKKFSLKKKKSRSPAVARTHLVGLPPQVPQPPPRASRTPGARVLTAEQRALRARRHGAGRRCLYGGE